MSRQTTSEQDLCTASRFTGSTIRFPCGTTRTARPSQLLPLHASREAVRAETAPSVLSGRRKPLRNLQDAEWNRRHGPVPGGAAILR